MRANDKLYESLCAEHFAQLAHTAALARYGAALDAAIQQLIVLTAPISTAHGGAAVNAIHDASAVCEDAKNAALTLVHALRTSSVTSTTTSALRIHAGWVTRQNSAAGAEHGVYDQRSAQRTSCEVPAEARTARVIEAIDSLRVDIAHAAHAAPGASLHDRIRLLHAAAPIIEGSSLAPSRSDVAAAQRSRAGVGALESAYRAWSADMVAMHDAHGALRRARNDLALHLGGEPFAAREWRSVAAASPASPAALEPSTVADRRSARAATLRSEQLPDAGPLHPLLGGRPRNNRRHSPPRRASPAAASSTASSEATIRVATPTTSSPLSKTNFAAAAFHTPLTRAPGSSAAAARASPETLENELVRRDEHIALLSGAKRAQERDAELLREQLAAADAALAAERGRTAAALSERVAELARMERTLEESSTALREERARNADMRTLTGVLTGVPTGAPTGTATMDDRSVDAVASGVLRREYEALLEEKAHENAELRAQVAREVLARSELLAEKESLASAADALAAEKEALAADVGRLSARRGAKAGALRAALARADALEEQLAEQAELLSEQDAACAAAVAEAKAKAAARLRKEARLAKGELARTLQERTAVHQAEMRKEVSDAIHAAQTKVRDGELAKLEAGQLQMQLDVERDASRELAQKHAEVQGQLEEERRVAEAKSRKQARELQRARTLLVEEQTAAQIAIEDKRRAAAVQNVRGALPPFSPSFFSISGCGADTPLNHSTAPSLLRLRFPAPRLPRTVARRARPARAGRRAACGSRCRARLALLRSRGAHSARTAPY